MINLLKLAKIIEDKNKNIKVHTVELEGDYIFVTGLIENEYCELCKINVNTCKIKVNKFTELYDNFILTEDDIKNCIL